MRILFVDDDLSVLEGLRNVLRKQRHQWDMVFALGGDAGITELHKTPFDVVVSDMQMPGIDGATLLRKVQELMPRAARIVLSGHSDRSAVVQALPVAHQFLNKPCHPDLLQAAILRVCDLNSLLSDDALRGVVTGLDKLPSVPHAYFELARLAADPDVSLIQVARIIESDPAMTAKVLQLVNSAYFGLSCHVTSVQQALLYLGIELVRALVLTANVFATATQASPTGFSMAQLQEHSIRTGQLARKLVPTRARAEEAFAAAILHDIGKIVLAQCVPLRFAEVLKQAAQTQVPTHEVEKELLGVTHAEVGAYLLGVWGVPFTIVEAVAYHHTPGRVAAGACEVLVAVHVADVLSHAEGEDVTTLDLEFLKRAGYSDALDGWRALAAEQRMA